MKRSRVSIISFILTILIMVSSIPVSAVSDKETYLNDTSSSEVSQKSDFYVDDKVPGEIAEETEQLLYIQTGWIRALLL
ncbi:MAG: hypothetical protein ILO53_04530 [Clostridia bacterium]|nr:hypothetical protein [Clostridia bacterium]